jgi:hypothetical protein
MPFKFVLLTAGLVVFTRMSLAMKDNSKNTYPKSNYFDFFQDAYNEMFGHCKNDSAFGKPLEKDPCNGEPEKPALTLADSNKDVAADVNLARILKHEQDFKQILSDCCSRHEQRCCNQRCQFQVPNASKKIENEMKQKWCKKCSEEKPATKFSLEAKTCTKCTYIQQKENHKQSQTPKVCNDCNEQKDAFSFYPGRKTCNKCYYIKNKTCTKEGICAGPCQEVKKLCCKKCTWCDTCWRKEFKKDQKNYEKVQTCAKCSEEKKATKFPLMGKTCTKCCYIQQKKNNEQSQKPKVCKNCNQEKPVSKFRTGGKKCNKCYNIQRKDNKRKRNQSSFENEDWNLTNL